MEAVVSINTLQIAKIRRDGQTQPRQGINEDAISDYVTALANGEQFPAIDVMFDGVDYWLFDGFHRVESYLRSGRTEITAKIHQGTLEDAQWHSYGANKGHGLQRSTADKERAIRSALRHPKAPGMSDSALAKYLGVSDKTVTKYRLEMESASEIPKLEVRTGIDGKTYATGNIGKRSSFVKLNPPAPKTDTEPAPIPLTFAETKSTIYGVLTDEAGTDEPAELLKAMASRFVAGHYTHKVNPGRCIDSAVFFEAYKQVRNELQARLLPPKPEPSLDRPLPSWIAGEPDKPLMDEDEDTEAHTSAMVNLAERENKSSSLMATPTAVDLRLPSMAIPDKDLFVSQVKRSVGVLSEEGYATVANFLRIVGRYAFDAQPAPLDAPEAPRADDGGQSREERIIGMTSILETALMLVVEDYGQLTGKWTHVAPAERALKQLIEVLKENLTK